MKLTAKHPSSSHDQPVLVIGNQSYGPCDPVSFYDHRLAWLVVDETPDIPEAQEGQREQFISLGRKLCD